MDKRFIFRYRTVGVKRGRRRNGRAHLLDMVRDLVKPGPGINDRAIGEARAKAPERELESPAPHCLEKPLNVDDCAPVPQTDTGR
jgi:hypothetical protein